MKPVQLPSQLGPSLGQTLCASEPGKCRGCQAAKERASCPAGPSSLPPFQKERAWVPLEQEVSLKINSVGSFHSSPWQRRAGRAFLSSVTPDRAALHPETCLPLRVLCPSCYYKLPGQLRGLQRTNVIAPFRPDICRGSCGSKRGTESHPLKGPQSDSAQAHRGFRSDGDSSGLRQYEEKGWVRMGWGGLQAST